MYPNHSKPSPLGLYSYSNTSEPTASENTLFIFPPSAIAPSPISLPTIEYNQTTNPRPRIFSPLRGTTPIFVRFRGRRAPIVYSRIALQAFSELPPRLELSMWAHLRLAGKRVIPPHTTDPSTCIQEGTTIDLCDVAFAVDMNDYPTRTAFGLMLQRLAPTVGAPEHFVEEWDMVCRRCGAEIRHYYTDQFWNGRYLQHRAEPQCKNRQGL